MVDLAERVYQFKIVIRGVSPMIWRRILLPENQTLAELHRAILICFDWMDLHLHDFLIHGRQYGLYKPGGGSFDESADRVSLAQLQLRESQKFVYTYDYYDRWQHDIRLEKIEANQRQLRLALCIGGKGRGPLEDCGGAAAYQHLVKVSRYGPVRDYLVLCLRLGELFTPLKFDRREANKKLKSGYWPEEIIRIAVPDDPFDGRLRQLISYIDFGTFDPPEDAAEYDPLYW